MQPSMRGWLTLTSELPEANRHASVCSIWVYCFDELDLSLKREFQGHLEQQLTRPGVSSSD